MQLDIFWLGSQLLKNVDLEQQEQTIRKQICESLQRKSLNQKLQVFLCFFKEVYVTLYRKFSLSRSEL
jgi:hypothetical protein